MSFHNLHISEPSLFFAYVGLFTAVSAYATAWNMASRNGRPEQFWDNWRYRVPGLGMSLAFFFLSSNAFASPGTGWPAILVATFYSMALAIAFCILLFGLALLGSYWVEALGRLRKARPVDLLKAMPASIFWLALGFATMVMLGYLGEKLGPLLSSIELRHIFMALIAYSLERIWTSGSPVGVLLRLILLLLFSLALLFGVGGLFYMVCREVAVKLVETLAAVVFVNFCVFFPFLRARLLAVG